MAQTLHTLSWTTKSLTFLSIASSEPDPFADRTVQIDDNSRQLFTH